MKEIFLIVLQIFTIVAAIITVILGVAELYAKEESVHKIKRTTLIFSAITAISAIFMFYLDTSIEKEKDRKFKIDQAKSKIEVAKINAIASNAQKTSDSLQVVAKELAYKIKNAENEIQVTKNQTLVLEGKNIELVSCQLDIVVYVLYLRQKNYDKVQNYIKQNRT